MSQIWIVPLADKNDYIPKITFIFLNYDTDRGILGHVHANLPSWVKQHSWVWDRIILFNTVVSSTDATLSLM